MKLITAFKKSLDLINVDNCSTEIFHVTESYTQITVNGFNIYIYKRKEKVGKVEKEYHAIQHGNLSENLTDEEYKELFQIANEKNQKVWQEKRASYKKISEEELNNFIK